MPNEKSKVIVELYDLAITERKDDRFGRVVRNKMLNEDDLIRIAVARRTDLNPTTLKICMDILKDIAKEQLTTGASVAFGLGNFSLTVNGVFIGDNAGWDSTKHKFSVRIIPTAELRNSLKAINVNVRGMAMVGLCINSVTDIISGEVNIRLTPGGAVNLIGSKLRLAGDDPAVGIRLINQQDETTIQIPPTAIAMNNPSKIIFVVPADLPAGDYKLQITTQYSNTTTLLKEPRTYVFEYILAV